MSKNLEKLIKIIDEKIKECENTEEYMPLERQLIEDISSNNSFNDFMSQCNFSASKLIMLGIILNDDYNDLESILKVILNDYKVIDYVFRLFYKIILLTNGNIIDIDEFDEYAKQSNIIFKKSKLQEVYKIYQNFVHLYSLCDNEFFSIIIDIINIELSKSDFISKNRSFNKVVNLDKFFRSEMEDHYDIPKIQNQLDRVYNYYLEMIEKNNEIVKKAKKDNKRLTELKSLLLLTEKSREITQIDRINALLDDEIRYDTLRYIANKNSEYYEELEKKYKKIKSNSVKNYIRLFSEIGVNFSAYSKEIQEKLLKLDVEFIEEVFNFSYSIDYKITNNVSEILLGTTSGIIKDIKNYIRKGILTPDFVKNNINILLSVSLSNEDPLYEKFISNINLLLLNGINIINLEPNSLSIFLGDYSQIRQNIELMDIENINIRTRNIKDYMFLTYSNLSNVIMEIKGENIDINSNLYLLNADEFVVKRIKICNSIGINIYDENGNIRKEIMNEKSFFIPNSKLDEYIYDKKLI